MDIERIRNFCIIAHVNHGKSTLADRFIQLCGGLEEREMSSQVLDSMDIERERGITIKAQSVSLEYHHAGDGAYRLNLIDTPGHVDFSYEVSRSLAACEGALLLVDAAQGVEAQSVANCYTAVDQGLEVLPVLNKIDLPQAEPERICREIEEVIGLPAHDVVAVSAKTGSQVEALLRHAIERISPPRGDRQAPLQALIIDSWFDSYMGVVSLVRVTQGSISPGQKIVPKSTGRTHRVDEVGIFTPKRQPTAHLAAGEVGFVVAGIKEIKGAPVGDTLIDAGFPDTAPLPGFKRVKPQIYAGMFPVSSDQFENFRDALAKLSLNDASLFYEPDLSAGLGMGFRCGFLGMLHMDILQERLEREYGLDLVVSTPTVVYEVILKDASIVRVDNPSRLPDAGLIREIREPVVLVSILTPRECLGAIIKLCVSRRGVQKDLQYTERQVMLVHELPMIEVVVDFFDRLKSLSRGFASMDYSFSRFVTAPMTRMDVLINGERIDALASIVHREEAYKKAQVLVERMKELIPRQMFDIAIQAAIGSRIIARSTVKALRKNVTAKCYGGDMTRKKKLLEKQKAGKKRMKRLGRVDIPQAAFHSLFKSDS